MSNGNGGVRNLRAMFESNSQPASPDVRGRSPAARSNGDTSRPLSKVRTNFVSVEPAKRTPRDETPTGSDTMHRRESFSLNENRPSDAAELSEIKKTVSQELVKRMSNSSVAEPVPENAIASEAPTPFLGGVDKQLGMPVDSTNVPSVTSTSVSRATSESRPDTQMLDSSPPVQPAKEQKSGFSPSPRVMRNLAENLRTPKPASEIPDAPPSPTPAPKRTETKKPEVKQTPVAMKNGTENPKSTPATKKTPSVKATQVYQAVPEAQVVTTEGESLATEESIVPDTAQTVPEATSGAERSTRAKPRTSSGTVTTGGFVKPKPRSPTRPVKLPAHLVAPTASSAAKHGDSPPANRTLSRRSSTISNASRRPSVRPKQHPPMPSRPKQPKPQAEQVAPSPKSPSSAAPSSFLERMMRPTASSASKVKDKIDEIAPGKKRPFK